MTLDALHEVCRQLAYAMRGPVGALLMQVVAATAPAAAWARACTNNPDYEMTKLDIDRIVDAFGMLAEALAATGLRLRDDGMHAAAWTRSGRVEMGAG